MGRAIERDTAAQVRHCLEWELMCIVHIEY